MGAPLWTMDISPDAYSPLIPATPDTSASSINSRADDAFALLSSRSLSFSSDFLSQRSDDNLKPLPDPTPADAMALNVQPQKRGRGRPRKHTVKPPVSTGNGISGRSKTGCITCRRRKKKCDESGPPCLNCQRTANVTCEGYLPLKTNKSETNVVNQPHQMPTLPPAFDNEIDSILLDYFQNELSNVLCIAKYCENSYKTIILPMAYQHGRLMHAILSFSALHLRYRFPSAKVEERQDYHLLEASKGVGDIINCTNEELEDAVIAKALIFCLMAIFSSDSSRQEQFDLHLDIINHERSKTKAQNKRNSAFCNMMDSFRIHSAVCRSITSIDHRDTALNEFNIPSYLDLSDVTPLLGIHDPVFWFISRITTLRDRIRLRRNFGRIFVVDEATTAEAYDLEQSIKSLSPYVPRRLQISSESEVLHKLSLLYRLCVRVYLQRTYLPSIPDATFSTAVAQGLNLLDSLRAEPSANAVLLMPIFLLGCAAFDEPHRASLRRALRELYDYRKSGNVESAYKVLQRLWQLMDSHDDRSWDWEALSQSMGLKFLVS